jgi:hypothetical protein
MKIMRDNYWNAEAHLFVIIMFGDWFALYPHEDFYFVLLILRLFQYGASVQLAKFTEILQALNSQPVLGIGCASVS